jgi:hypothetical protein
VQNPQEKYQAVQLLQFFEKRVKIKNENEIFIGWIGCLEVSLESLVVTQVDGTKFEI